MTCPRCSHPLVPETRGDLVVDACAACGGTWFDRGELERELARDAPSPEGQRAPPPAAVRYLACPRCAQLMSRRNYERYSGAVLDYCNAHGVWADPGEVEKARAFLDDGGLQKKQRKEAEEARVRAGVEGYARTHPARSTGGVDWIDLVFDLG